MGKMIRMTMDDGAEIAAYHVEPEGERRGGLVLVQEIFGVTDHIRELCDEYAADGYEVLSPAIFDREHPGFEADYTGPDYNRAVELARDLHPFAQSHRIDRLQQEIQRTARASGMSLLEGARELVAGYWIWEVKSKEEAIEWVKRCPNPMRGESEIEIRRVFEAEDFGEAFTPELREQEERLREQLIAQHKR